MASPPKDALAGATKKGPMKAMEKLAGAVVDITPLQLIWKATHMFNIWPESEMTLTGHRRLPDSSLFIENCPLQGAHGKRLLF